MHLPLSSLSSLSSPCEVGVLVDLVPQLAAELALDVRARVLNETRGGTIYKVDVNSALIDLESSLMYRYFARCSKDFFYQ